MDALTHLTEFIANINSKWVLVGVGSLLVVLAALRIASRESPRQYLTVIDNLQVIVSVVVIVFLLIRPYLFQPYYIPSDSMVPTLLGPTEGQVSGDRILADKLIYLLRNPKQREIVVFHAPLAATQPEDQPEGTEYIKRTIGLPGQTVEVVPPELLVDGQVAAVLDHDARDALDPVIQLRPDQDPRAVVRVSGPFIDLKTRTGDKLRVVATEKLDTVHFDGQVIRVDGQPVERIFPGAAVHQSSRLDLLGASPKLNGVLFTVNDNAPVLAVVQGKSLSLVPGHVNVDHRTLDEPYVNEPPHYAMSPRHLGPREYFMMGDNRNVSNDSHVWGPVTRDRIIGRAEVLFWPLNRFRVFNWFLLGVFAAIIVAYQLLLRAFGKG